NSLGLLSQAAKTVTWNIGGPNSGTAAGVSFSNSQSLLGGDGKDIFKFAASASLAGTLDGGANTNTLDDSALTGRVVVDLVHGATTGVKNSASGGLSRVQSFLGSSATNNLFVGPSVDTTWNITAPNAGNATTTTGSLSFTSFQNLTGGTGKD